MTCSAPKEAEANDIGLDAIKANSLLGGREETLLHSDGNDAVRDVFFPSRLDPAGLLLMTSVHAHRDEKHVKIS